MLVSYLNIAVSTTLPVGSPSNRVLLSFRDGARTSSPMSHSKQRRIAVPPVSQSRFCPADFAAPDFIDVVVMDVPKLIFDLGSMQRRPRNMLK